MVMQLETYLGALHPVENKSTKDRLRYFFTWALDSKGLPPNIPENKKIFLESFIITGQRIKADKEPLIGVLKEYSEWDQMQTLSENTNKSYLTNNKLFIQWMSSHTNEEFNPLNITPSLIKTYRDELVKTNTPGTTNTKLMAIMSLCNFLVEKDFLESNPAKRIRGLLCDEVSNGEDKWLSPREQSLLIHRLEKENILLDITMVLVMLDAGLRPSEVVKLDLNNLTLYPVNQSKIYINNSKRNKSRSVPMKFIEKRFKDKMKYIGGRLHEALRKYIDFRENQYGSDQEALFILRGKRIDYQYLHQRVEYYRQLTGIRRLNPRTLRHSFAKNLKDNGASDTEVAFLLGHTKKNGDPNIQMVARYTKPGTQDLQRTVNRLSE
ncbi:tyrosine-type recombinase/integrase [Desulforamulus ruminis]|nr:tyrosine-type recombinase/integrase [Desulforamulus ruminis]